MHHPETLLLAPLMAADFLLTRLGARRGDRQRVLRSTSGAPVNPLWRRAVARSRHPFAHVAYVLCVGTAFVFACRDVDADDPLLALLVGFFAGFYGTLIGLEVSALAITSALGQRRRDVVGQLTIDDDASIAIATPLVAIALLPLALVALIAARAETLGALGGALALIVVHWAWRAHERHRGEREAITLRARSIGLEHTS
jgi:hypothetical protein